MPPCKHYGSMQDMQNDASRFVSTNSFKTVVSPNKRETILKLVKEQSTASLHAMASPKMSTGMSPYPND